MEALVDALASFILQLVVLHMQLRLLADHMMVSDIFVGVSSYLLFRELTGLEATNQEASLCTNVVVIVMLCGKWMRIQPCLQEICHPNFVAIISLEREI